MVHQLPVSHARSFGCGLWMTASRALPDVADDLATDLESPSLLTTHDSLRCRDHRDAEAAVNARDIGSLRVDAQPGLADPLDPRQHRLLLAGVLQIHAQHL